MPHILIFVIKIMNYSINGNPSNELFQHNNYDCVLDFLVFFLLFKEKITEKKIFFFCKIK